ncbi:hypothetical protein [Streptomyces niveus]|uniref:hypothetical protein n=1 Tax=Streptomyces niveus TaxID=193462 RepID=UPI0003C5D3FA|nr:hypothetical protein [Streptomyces niveus]EST22800.1 hypothetical protein M877_28905 [Streptomyces niveus NCIMB 11891]
MSEFRYDPADLDEADLAALDGMSDDELAELFDQHDADEPLLLLAGYGRPANAAPHPVDPYRGLDTLPAIDDYRPSEVTR